MGGHFGQILHEFIRMEYVWFGYLDWISGLTCLFLDAIASPSSCPYGWVSQSVGGWVVDSFRFPIFISHCCWCVDPSGPMRPMWTLVDPGGPKWTQWTQVDLDGPRWT